MRLIEEVKGAFEYGVPFVSKLHMRLMFNLGVMFSNAMSGLASTLESRVTLTVQGSTWIATHIYTPLLLR